MFFFFFSFFFFFFFADNFFFPPSPDFAVGTKGRGFRTSSSFLFDMCRPPIDLPPHPTPHLMHNLIYSPNPKEVSFLKGFRSHDHFPTDLPS